MAAYRVGINLRDQLRMGTGLCAALGSVDGSFETLDDGYPAWHPATCSFHGMCRLFLDREITGQSYRTLAQYPELADVFGLERIPGESVLSRTWRTRFDAGVREFITTAAHSLVKAIHDRAISVPDVRPKADVVTATKDPSAIPDDVDGAGADNEFTNEEIHRTTHLARDLSFDGFESGRAANATYEDTRFFELQTFIGMVGCGTAQGATRFQYRRGRRMAPTGTRTSGLSSNSSPPPSSTGSMTRRSVSAP